MAKIVSLFFGGSKPPPYNKIQVSAFKQKFIL